MKFSYHDCSDQNYHGYQYYYGIVKMYWKCLDTQIQSIDTHNEIISLSFTLKTNKQQFISTALINFTLLGSTRREDEKKMQSKLF